MEIKAVRIIPILLFFRAAPFSESCDCVRTGYSFGGFGDFLHSAETRSRRNGGGFRLRIGSPRQWLSGFWRWRPRGRRSCSGGDQADLPGLRAEFLKPYRRNECGRMAAIVFRRRAARLQNAEICNQRIFN